MNETVQPLNINNAATQALHSEKQPVIENSTPNKCEVGQLQRNSFNNLNGYFNNIGGLVSMLSLILSIISVILTGYVYDLKNQERKKFIAFIEQVVPPLNDIQQKTAIIKEVNDTNQIRENADYIQVDVIKIHTTLDNYQLMMKMYFLNE